MKLLKIELNKECHIIAAVDDANTILTTGAFTNDEDAETASDVLYTLLVNLGLLQNRQAPSATKLPELLNMVTGAKVYVKDLSH